MIEPSDRTHDTPDRSDHSTVHASHQDWQRNVTHILTPEHAEQWVNTITTRNGNGNEDDDHDDEYPFMHPRKICIEDDRLKYSSVNQYYYNTLIRLIHSNLCSARGKELSFIQTADCFDTLVFL